MKRGADPETAEEAKTLRAALAPEPQVPMPEGAAWTGEAIRRVREARNTDNRRWEARPERSVVEGALGMPQR